MEIIHSNNPTSGTIEVHGDNYVAKVYNYCPCCRGELAPCSTQTELQLQHRDKIVYAQYKDVLAQFQNMENVIQITPPAARNGKWIDLKFGSEIRPYKFNMTMHEFLEIYKLMVDKHKETI